MDAVLKKMNAHALYEALPFQTGWYPKVPRSEPSGKSRDSSRPRLDLVDSKAPGEVTSYDGPRAATPAGSPSASRATPNGTGRATRERSRGA
jgi:hypothetical protein